MKRDLHRYYRILSDTIGYYQHQQTAPKWGITKFVQLRLHFFGHLGLHAESGFTRTKMRKYGTIWHQYGINMASIWHQYGINMRQYYDLNIPTQSTHTVSIRTGCLVHELCLGGSFASCPGHGNMKASTPDASALA